MVESTFSYLAEMAEKPAYWITTPPPGQSWRNTRGDHRVLRVENARALDPAPALDDAGFTLARHGTAVADLYDAAAVRSEYYREMERLVAGVTGATRVLAFDHNVRNRLRAERREDGAQGPVRFVHNDYTERSGPQRVRDLLGDEAEALLRHRVAVVNVWKPIRGPVQATPLAVCDARSIGADDFVLTDLRYADRTGEIQSLRFNPAHRWFYYPAQQADEALLLKCYDSERGVARFTAHSAFDDPTSPPDAPARESIEVRTLAFFAPAG
jgi:choline dehydrogenase-like flavoprotein